MKKKKIKEIELKEERKGRKIITNVFRFIYKKKFLEFSFSLQIRNMLLCLLLFLHHIPLSIHESRSATTTKNVFY